MRLSGADSGGILVVLAGPDAIGSMQWKAADFYTVYVGFRPAYDPRP